MSPIRPILFTAWFWLGAAAWVNAAELQWNLTTEAGQSSNIFDSPEEKADRYTLSGATLRGTIGHDDRQVAFAVSVAQKKLARYDFGDERTIESEFVYRVVRGDVAATLEAAFARQDGGDLFASIGGVDIGYRSERNRLAFAGSLATTGRVGTTTLTASYRSLRHSEARFNQPGLLPVRLEPQYGENAASIRHDVSLGIQQIAAKVSWIGSRIPEEDRDLYVRYPAQVAALSAIWAASFVPGFAVQVEAGSANLVADELGEYAGWYPFYGAEAKWALGDHASISAGIGRSLMLAEIDDAVAEDVRKSVIRLASRLSDAMEVELAWEHSASHQLYFDYPTQSRTWSAGLAWQISNGVSAKLAYAGKRHDEFDPAFGYSGRQVSVSLNARF